MVRGWSVDIVLIYTPDANIHVVRLRIDKKDNVVVSVTRDCKTLSHADIKAVTFYSV